MSNAAIELKGITKRFGSVTANSNISMTVNKGEILSILGENGSGKTTLMNSFRVSIIPTRDRFSLTEEKHQFSHPRMPLTIKSV